MNRLHRWYCSSQAWNRKIEKEILPWALEGVDLGAHVLEVGPGPGLTTEWLRHRCQALTCIEVNQELARALQKRTRSSGIRVDCADATTMPYPDRSFSAVVLFTVLHHVPSVAQQNRLFAEAYRVLSPGGIFAGVDSLQSMRMRLFHVGDTMVLVDPEGLPARLHSAGFRGVTVEIGRGRFRFLAQRAVQASAQSTPAAREQDPVSKDRRK